MKSGDTNDNDIKVNSDDLFTDSEDTEFRLDISEDFFEDNEQTEGSEEEFKNKSFSEEDEESFSDPEVLTEEALLEGDAEDVTSDDSQGEQTDREEVEEAFDETDFDETELDETEFDETDLDEDSSEDEVQADRDEDSLVDEEQDVESEYDDEDFVEFVDDGTLGEEGSEEPSEGDDGNSGDGDGDGGDGNGDNGDGDRDDGEVDFTEEDGEEEEDTSEESSGRRNLGLKIFLGFVAAVVVFAIWLLGTNVGRSFGLGIAAKFIKRTMDAGEVADREARNGEISVEGEEYTGPTVIGDTGLSISEEELPLDEAIRQRASLLRSEPPRSEDYVKTYLMFGIEEIDGASNTDAIMLVSINTKDNTIKLTSILRDTLVDIPGYYPNKINSVYAIGAYNAESAAEGRAQGAALLTEVIERIFDVKISGYAFVNFNRFERIIDSLGGIDLQLGAEEAEYLRTTNYISNKENRKGIVEGWNYGLNGNQVLGYVRVRKVATLGGADNDYGRTVRQRRVINAIIEKYKSVGLSDMLSIATECLGYVRTNLTEDQIKDILVDVVNNKIFTTKSSRVPFDNLFYDSGRTGVYNGKSTITWALVMDENIDENIKKLHQFIFLDEAE